MHVHQDDGFGRLFLVNPRFDGCPLLIQRPLPFASGAQDVLEAATICTSVSEALRDVICWQSVARLGEFSPCHPGVHEFAAGWSV